MITIPMFLLKLCRFRGRRSRSRSPSVSRSPVRYRSRRYSRSRTPVRSRSPVERYRGSPRPERRRSPSRSKSRSKSQSSRGSESPSRAEKGPSRSPPSGSSLRKAGLVSYDDGSSPESDRNWFHSGDGGGSLADLLHLCDVEYAYTSSLLEYWEPFSDIINWG